MSSRTADFLVELARALQRFGMYPPGHPEREKTAATLKEQLDEILSDRGDLRLDIARESLGVDGAQTDPQNTILANLAGRLYQHQLFTMTFHPGVDEREIAHLLATVSLPVGAEDRPLGAEPPDRLNRWPHIRLEPVPFDTLTFSTGVTEEAADDRGLERGGDIRPAGIEEDRERLQPDASDAAGGKQEGGGATAAAEAEPEPEENLQKRIARLILKLDPDMLRDLVRKIETTVPHGGTGDYITEAVRELLRAAESGALPEPSAALVKLMTKMGIHGGGEGSDEPPDPAESAAIGELVKQLGSEWNIDDPSPADYKNALAGLSRQAPILGMEPVWVEAPEPDRIIQISLELDETGPMVEKAVNDMLAAKRLGELLELLESTPAGTEALETLWDWTAQPETVLQLLRAEPPGFEMLDRLLPRLDARSADPMIEVLGESESAARSDAIIERLVQLGPGVRPKAVNWLVDERWHVRRNMLALLSRFDDLPEDFSPAPYLVDPDPRVRREAMRLGLRAWTEIEAVIVAALEDSDPQIVELGLEAAKKECPPLVVPYLVAMVLDERVAPVSRVGAIHALAGSGSEKALPTLLRLTWVRKVFWFRGLAEKSSEMLAALSALATRWPEDPKAQKVLRAAGKSKDAQVRAVALRAGGRA